MPQRKRSKKQFVEIQLGYFKQGDDMSSCLEQIKDPEKAFRAHAAQMRSVADHLEAVADKIKGHKVSVDADTHFIGLGCDAALAKALLKADLACKPFDEEDDQVDLCPDCKGSGVDHGGIGHEYGIDSCPKCGGTGKRK